MNWSESRGFMIAAGAFVALVVAMDFAGRLFVGRDASLRVFSAPVVTPVPAAIEKSAALASIQRWLPGKPSEAADTKPREIVLQGAFVVAGQPRAALSLVSAVGLPPQRVKAVVGDVVEGWTIVAIDKRKVVLRRGDESREIWMFRRR